MRITDKSLSKAAKVKMGQLNVQTQPIYQVR